MFLIVGLGNPGKQYEHTFHNVGFLTLDILAEKLGWEIDHKKCDAQIAVCQHEGLEIILAKPQTYMNNSGQSVKQLKKKFNLKDEQILTISDDIDLEKGKFRFRESGSAGTHNGLRSIVKELNSTNFKRIRIGIGRGDGDLADYVLSKINKTDFDMLSEVMNQVANYILANIHSW